MLADAVGVVDSSVQHFTLQSAEFAGLDHPDELLTSNVASVQLLMAATGALGRASAVTFSAKGSELEQALTASDIVGVLAALLTDQGFARKFGEKIVGIDTIRHAHELALRIAKARHQADA